MARSLRRLYGSVVSDGCAQSDGEKIMYNNNFRNRARGLSHVKSGPGRRLHYVPITVTRPGHGAGALALADTYPAVHEFSR